MTNLAKARAIGRKRRRLGQLWPMPIRETDLGHIYVDATVRAAPESTKSWTGRFLVDTGATDTFLPASALRKLGIKPAGHRIYELADGTEEELAIGIGERLDLERLQVEDAHLLNRLGNLLAIGADILHRRSAHGAGDSGQALDAGGVVGDGSLHEAVPILAGSDAKHSLARIVFGFHSAQRDVEDEAVESAIGDEEIAAAAEHKQGRVMLAGPIRGGDDVVLRAGRDEPARRAADTEGRIRGKGSVFFDQHSYEATSARRQHGKCRKMEEGNLLPEV